MQWWRQVVRFAAKFQAMPSDCLHRDILKDNVCDARSCGAAGNWAHQLTMRAQDLGLPDPFDASGGCIIDPAEHRSRAAQSLQSVWEETHISPRTCPSRGAKLCTYHRWFLRPAPVAEPYFQLPLSRGSLRQLFRFRLSAHSLPIEQGRRGAVPRAMRVCPHCPGHSPGDERHLVFECPAFEHIRRQYAHVFQDARSTMRLFVWHEDQKAVASCLLRLLSEYEALLD